MIGWWNHLLIGLGLRPHPDDRWARLAVYNAEKDRGIVHTLDYDREMRAEQARYGAAALEEMNEARMRAYVENPER